MKTSWKGVSGISETGSGLLLMTIRQEYDLIINPKQIDVFLSAINKLAENRQVSHDVEFDWELQFESIRIFISRISDGMTAISDISIETPWQSLPSSDFIPILEELKRIFASGVAVSISGVAPDFSIQYRFGTYLLERKLDMSNTDHLLQIVEKLNNAAPVAVENVLDRISKGNVSAIAGLNELVGGGVDLAGGPLGGLAIALAVAATTKQSPFVKEYGSTSEKAMPPALPIVVTSVPTILAFVGAGILGAAKAYEAYQVGQRAKADKDRINYELQRQKLHDIEQKECKPVREIPDSGGGPAADGARDRASRYC